MDKARSDSDADPRATFSEVFDELVMAPGTKDVSSTGEWSEMPSYEYGFMKERCPIREEGLLPTARRSTQMIQSLVNGMSKVMDFAQILMDRQRHQASTLPGKSERHRKGGNRLHHCSFGSQLVVDLLNFMAEEKYVCVCV